MEKKQQQQQPTEKLEKDFHHKNIEHDQEVVEKPITTEDDPDIIPDVEELEPPAFEPPPPGEGP